MIKEYKAKTFKVTVETDNEIVFHYVEDMIKKMGYRGFVE